MTEKVAGEVKGSPLRQRMIDQMRIANLAASTQTSYLFEVERMAKHYGASPADLDEMPRRRDRLLRICRGVADRDRHRQAEHAPAFVDMLDGKLERPLPVLQDLGRAAAEIHQQPDPERSGFVRPRRRRLSRRARQRHAHRPQQHTDCTRPE